MKKQLIYLLTVLISSQFLIAQDSKLNLAQKKYDELAYPQAIKLYEELAKDGYKSKELFENLANAYYYKADFAPAKIWYDSLFTVTDDLSANTYNKYVNALKTEGNYEKADVMMQKMGVKYPNDARVKVYNMNKEYLLQSTKATNTAKVKNAGINSPYFDFSPAFFGEKSVVFSSTKSTKKSLLNKHTWTNESFTNLYVVDFDKDSLIKGPKGFNAKINKFYNESSAVFTKDGKTMYFTRNNQLKTKAKTDTLNTVLLKIYRATFDGKKWTNVIELPFNSDNFSCAHPALSPDEKELYFSSNRPGNKGMSDIYKIAILENDTFGEPENLGDVINTEGRETFPFITQDNVLIFASDARAGLGGLDMYYLHLDSENKEIKTFGQPINSSFDDFGLIYKDKIQDGFFTSNRPEDNKGKDDIYRFKELEIPKIFKVNAAVLEEANSQPVEAIAVLLDENKKQITELISKDGKFEVPDLEQQKNYFVTITHPDYETYEGPISFKENQNNLVFKLKKKVLELSEVDLAKILGIRIIYFDLNKSLIRNDAALELQKIADIMKAYPQMNIDVRSHTDSQYASEYNQKLSQKRAESTRDWLINQCIAPERLKASGYGESKLINECADGITCTEEQHQENRRSEFIIID
jgi:outer membrane protein OmpA-like peptidoglycan-associated protein/Tol biopolymer transport system component